MSFLSPKKLIVVLTILSAALLKGQGIENILRYKTIDDIRVRISELERENKNNAGVLYLKAAIEVDGKQAVDKYEQLILLYPQSKYADDAKFKISQYYFSLGFYNLAYEQFRELIWQYPNSPLRDDAAYSACQCLAAMDRPQKALAELTKFRQAFGKSPLSKLASEDINKMTKGAQYSVANPKKAKQAASSVPTWVPPKRRTALPPNNVPSRQDVEVPRQTRFLKSHYSVQVGAFLKSANAQKQKDYFTGHGYSVDIRSKKMNDQNLYIVCVNSFPTLDQAVEFGKMLNQKYRVSYQIIKLDDF